MTALVLCECPECECENLAALPDSVDSDAFGTPMCDDCREGEHFDGEDAD